MQLTKNFKLEEFEKSDTAKRLGIDNSVPKELIPNIKALCENVLEPLRAEINKTTDNRQQTTDSATSLVDSLTCGHVVNRVSETPVVLSSGYRSPALNKAVGGSATSQHMKGEAADIVIPDKKTGLQWFEWMRTHLTYNQLIWETNSRGGSWIHVGYKRTGKNKMQVLNMRVI
ncbi:MAG: D-Ala-D-Ala carboxypeptidase family metallohydrolase [Bacteroidales bacterium]|nr:D-Ala-D-Ala carboxypeptidase family metallohydrolase [Bacteroidales bacterium]